MFISAKALRLAKRSIVFRQTLHPFSMPASLVYRNTKQRCHYKYVCIISESFLKIKTHILYMHNKKYWTALGPAKLSPLDIPPAYNIWKHSNYNCNCIRR